MSHGRLLAATATLGLTATTLLLVTPASAAPENRGQGKTVSLRATLEQRNFSGASGAAFATVRNQKIQDFRLSATGVTPDAAHAVHIHYGETARNECPTMADASATRLPGRTPRLTTSDGVPAYGPIVVSLTTSGDTSPASGLALERFPVSAGGALNYARGGIEFTDVPAAGGGGATGTAKEIADAVRDGEGVVVVHGVDYNRNGEYDFLSAGASDLTAAAPAEATDPTMCGVLAPHDH